MPKKKRTRKQKILSDQRIPTQPPVIDVPSYSLNLSPVKPPTTPQQTPLTRPNSSVITTDYHYLSKDLLRTLFLTGAIVIVELLIHFSVKTI